MQTTSLVVHIKLQFSFMKLLRSSKYENDPTCPISGRLVPGRALLSFGKWLKAVLNESCLKLEVLYYD